MSHTEARRWRVPWEIILTAILSATSAGSVVAYLIRPVVADQIKPVEDRVADLTTRVAVLENEYRHIGQDIADIKEGVKEANGKLDAHLKWTAEQAAKKGER